MSIKVLVVDDSGFFRRRVTEMINGDPELEVIDSAVNGREAVDKAYQLKPDVITMDIEMPVLDGISAVREILKRQSVPILMFSSLTHEGAKATLDALDAGAADYLPKKFEDIAGSGTVAAEQLRQRIKAIGRRRRFAPSRPVAAKPVTPPPPRPAPAPRAPVPPPRRTVAATPDRPSTPSAPTRIKPSGKRYKLLAIASSTGGPVALQNILTKLPASYPHPILLVQHMPATFTGAFAERLNRLCKIQVKEAQHGDVLRPGCAYLAPGGQQMLVEKNHRLKVVEGPEKLNYKPCADLTFASVAKVYDGDVLALVLTGMGADGRDGCRMLKQQGANIWAQDEKTCVVYGMPQAVERAGLASRMFPIDEFADAIIRESANG